jgi:hypothetical protein
MPCNDAASQSHEDIEQVVTDGDCNDHEEGDHEGECSPFCQCNCCSVHVITYKFDTVESVDFLKINTDISSYLNPFYDGYDGSILQPPQLNS